MCGRGPLRAWLGWLRSLVTWHRKSKVPRNQVRWQAVCPPAAPGGGRLWLLFMGTPDRPLSLDPAGHRFSRFCDSPDFAAAELPQCMVCFDFDVDEVCSARLSPGQGPVRRPYSVPTWTSAVADSFGWGCRPGFTGAPVFPDRPVQALLPTASAGGAGPDLTGAPGVSPDHLITTTDM